MRRGVSLFDGISRRLDPRTTAGWRIVVRRPSKKMKRFVLCSAYLPIDLNARLDALVLRTRVRKTEFFRAGIRILLANPELVQESRS
jgi:hypothetical protein